MKFELTAGQISKDKHYFHPYLSASWNEIDLDKIREMRRLCGQIINEKPEKIIRKQCQRYVKVTSILLDYFEGKTATCRYMSTDYHECADKVLSLL